MAAQHPDNHDLSGGDTKPEMPLSSASEPPASPRAHHFLYLPPELRSQVYRHLLKYSPQDWPCETYQYKGLVTVPGGSTRQLPQGFWAKPANAKTDLFRVCPQLRSELSNVNVPPALLYSVETSWDVRIYQNLVDEAIFLDKMWVERQKRNNPAVEPPIAPLALKIPLQRQLKSVRKHIDNNGFVNDLEMLIGLEANLSEFLKTSLPVWRTNNTVEIYALVQLYNGQPLRDLKSLRATCYWVQRVGSQRVHGARWKFTVLLREHNAALERAMQDMTGLKWRLATASEAKLFPHPTLLYPYTKD